MKMKIFILQYVMFLLIGSSLQPSTALTHHYKFVVKETSYTRLCRSKKILTVNGQFPGPTLHLRQGERIVVHVFNEAKENVTLHWHGVKQPRHPWWDGPEYFTQCPIKPGSNFTQQILVTDEIGTLWWHAHSAWTRATVHGLLVVHPRKEDSFPFPKPHAQVPIVLGEWWMSDIKEVESEFLMKGGDPNASDAFLINGQPGDLYPCSTSDTFKLEVEYGKKYLLRIVNAIMNDLLFFSIAKHKMTVVGTDGAYTKPLKTDYITISPGQTMDVLLEANQAPADHYYMAARVYHNAEIVPYDNTTTTGIIKYKGNYTHSISPFFPSLPYHNDTNALTNFTGSLRSLANGKHLINVPLKVRTKLFLTLSMNTLPCRNCTGPGGLRLRASINNISFVTPNISILEAYYYGIKGVFGDEFPSLPPLKFNFTSDKIPDELQRPNRNTKVKVLKYNSSVEIVLQGTNVVLGIDHPIHLHGHSFYVVGWGMGNFDKKRDPLKYNLVDPPLQNTIAVPKNGWVALRFRANNPGVWLLHCHIQRHNSWGMEMAFIVKNGKRRDEKMVRPPTDMPLC